MKEDLESALRRMPLTKVPDHLDTSVEATIRQFESKASRPDRRRVPLWAAAIACAACAVAGFAAHPLLRSTERARAVSPSVVYIENLSDDLPDVFREGQRDRQVGFFENRHSDVRALDKG